MSRVDPKKLAKPAVDRAPAGEDLDDAFREWEQMAHGTPPRTHTRPIRHAEGTGAAPNVSRTATVHDPLTTGVLAEVTRRPEAAAVDEDEPPFAPVVPERPTRRLPQQASPRVTQNIIKRKRPR
ncbi:MAG: hypothetical protein KIT31_32265 [Deltaproteobacteria bacterium]|nr:hypothetical protein [Deltaproteobacteria bacterium]